ncbi:MAG: histidine phosphatase family protein, partial [Fimbriimonadaceae bacterium]
FRPERVPRILSSDLKRSLQTAEAVAQTLGVSVETSAALRERSFGEWEGLNFAELHARYEAHGAPDTPQHEIRPPGGESMVDVWNRLDAVVEMIRAHEDDLLVVTHGGTVSLLLAKLICGTIQTARSFRFGNTALTELRRRPDGRVLLLRYNDTTHLDGQPTIDGNLEGASR